MGRSQFYDRSFIRLLLYLNFLLRPPKPALKIEIRVYFRSSLYRYKSMNHRKVLIINTKVCKNTGPILTLEKRSSSNEVSPLCIAEIICTRLNSNNASNHGYRNFLYSCIQSTLH